MEAQAQKSPFVFGEKYFSSKFYVLLDMIEEQMWRWRIAKESEKN